MKARSRWLRGPGAVIVALGLALAAVALPTLAAQSNVSIVGKKFDPPTITIAAGDTVVWTVKEAIGEPHSVTSGGPAKDSGKDFDSGIKLRNVGDTFSFTFTTPGEYDYYCVVHPVEMTGHITVGAAGASGQAPSAGAGASPAPSGAGASGGPSAAPLEAPGEHAPPVNPTDKATAAGILAGAVILLFGSAWVYRRYNPAP